MHCPQQLLYTFTPQVSSPSLLPYQPMSCFSIYFKECNPYNVNPLNCLKFKQNLPSFILFFFYLIAKNMYLYPQPRLPPKSYTLTTVLITYSIFYPVLHFRPFSHSPLCTKVCSASLCPEETFPKIGYLLFSCLQYLILCSVRSPLQYGTVYTWTYIACCVSNKTS